MNFQCKCFAKYFSILWVVLILEGCISLAPPYQQIKYSTDFHIETMIAEISKETALKILEVNLRDNTNTSVYYDPLYFGVKLRENSKREDAVVTEEFISYNITYTLDSADLDSSKVLSPKNSKGKPHKSSLTLTYKDVKKIRLYIYKEIVGSYYRIYLYDKTNKPIFQFSFRCNIAGKQEANKVLAALSVLIPHVQEEYNEDDLQRYTNPMPFFQ